MRLAHLLWKNILAAPAGYLVNKFKISSRRDVLAPEELISNIIKHMNKNAQKNVGELWLGAAMQVLLPKFMRDIPLDVLFNKIMKKVWVSIGQMDNIKCSLEEHLFIVETENEAITRVIGENYLVPHAYCGCLQGITGYKWELIKKKQGKVSKYIFKKTTEKWRVDTVEKKIYIKRNSFPQRRSLLKNAIKKGEIIIMENKMFFRGKTLIPTENTFFHLLGEYANRQMLLEECKKFDELSLMSLKHFLEASGWGIVNVLKKGQEIKLIIRNYPYPLLPKVNFTFLASFSAGILGAEPIENQITKDYVTIRMKK